MKPLQFLNKQQTNKYIKLQDLQAQYRRQSISALVSHLTLQVAKNSNAHKKLCLIPTD